MSVARCCFPKADGVGVCDRIIPDGWDVCPAHLEARGREILLSSPERVAVTVEIPRSIVPKLGGLARSEWESVRLALADVPVAGSSVGGGADAS